MPLDINAVNKRLGLELQEKDVKRHLERMGHGYAKGMVTIPCYRADILHPVDLMEDIAIAYGYHNVLPLELPLSTIGRQNESHTFTDHVAGILVGFGLLEANTYHLTSETAQTGMMNARAAVVPLANALTAEYNCLRSWLLPGMLEILKANKHHDYPQRLFTHGTVFSPDAKAETGVGEMHHLSLISSHATADYTELRQVIDYLCKVLKLEPSYKPAEHASFIPGRCAELFIGSKKIGVVGELHPAVLEKWEIILPTVGAELDLDALRAST